MSRAAGRWQRSATSKRRPSAAYGSSDLATGNKAAVSRNACPKQNANKWTEVENAARSVDHRRGGDLHRTHLPLRHAQHLMRTLSLTAGAAFAQDVKCSGLIDRGGQGRFRSRDTSGFPEQARKLAI